MAKQVTTRKRKKAIRECEQLCNQLAGSWTGFSHQELVEFERNLTKKSIQSRVDDLEKLFKTVTKNGGIESGKHWDELLARKRILELLELHDCNSVQALIDNIP